MTPFLKVIFSPILTHFLTVTFSHILTHFLTLIFSRILYHFLTRMFYLSGDFIMEYVGEVFDSREFRRRRKEYANSSSAHFYFMSLRADTIIDLHMVAVVNPISVYRSYRISSN